MGKREIEGDRKRERKRGVRMCPFFISDHINKADEEE
jgi:hypothetical protein